MGWTSNLSLQADDWGQGADSFDHAVAKGQGSHRYRGFIRSAMLVIGCLLLSSCGSAEPSIPDALRADCNRVLKNLKKLAAEPEIFPDSQFVESDSYLVTNLGTNSRAKAERIIVKKFPWLDSVVKGRPASRQSIMDDTYGNLSIFILDQAVVGTSLEVPLTDTNREALRRPSIESLATERANAIAEELFGNPSLAGAQQKNCGRIELQKAKESGNWDFEIWGAWSQAQNTAYRFASWLELIRDCAVAGSHTGDKCAKRDYVSAGTEGSDSATDGSSCANSRLRITSNSGEPGVTCGKLGFTVFQADQNTGDCLALAWWNDKNDVQQVGAIYACGLEEGKYYDLPVILGDSTTYTNSFGVQKTVPSFSILS